MRSVMFVAVVLVSALTACAGATKKSQVTSAPYSFGYKSASVDDLNLVVSSVDSTPVGTVLVPKTTDLDAIMTIAPILILDGVSEESDERE